MAEVETYKTHALSSSQKSAAVSTCTKNFTYVFFVHLANKLHWKQLWNSELFWTHVNYLGLPNHWQGFWQQKWTCTTNSYYLWHALLFEYLSIVITLKLWMQAFDSSMHNIEIYCIPSKLWWVICKESLCLSNAVKWIPKIILCNFFDSTFTSLSLYHMSNVLWDIIFTKETSYIWLSMP